MDRVDEVLDLEGLVEEESPARSSRQILRSVQQIGVNGREDDGDARCGGDGAQLADQLLQLVAVEGEIDHEHIGLNGLDHHEGARHKVRGGDVLALTLEQPPRHVQERRVAFEDEDVAPAKLFSGLCCRGFRCANVEVGHDSLLTRV